LKHGGRKYWWTHSTSTVLEVCCRIAIEISSESLLYELRTRRAGTFR